MVSAAVKADRAARAEQRAKHEQFLQGLRDYTISKLSEAAIVLSEALKSADGPALLMEIQKVVDNITRLSAEADDAHQRALAYSRVLDTGSIAECEALPPLDVHAVIALLEIEENKSRDRDHLARRKRSHEVRNRLPGQARAWVIDQWRSVKGTPSKLDFAERIRTKWPPHFGYHEPPSARHIAERWLVGY